jgi:hypothetical protein
MKNNEDLMASLANIRVLQGRTPAIELDFVLTSRSARPVYIAERWNSWGAYQWSFEIVDARGHVCRLSNPNLVWLANYLTTAKIWLGERHITRCRLPMLSTDNQSKDDGVAWFRESGFQMERLPSGKTRPVEHLWQYPIQISGLFAAPQAFVVSELLPNGAKPLDFGFPELSGHALTWKGNIRTEVFNVLQNGVVKMLPRSKPK